MVLSKHKILLLIAGITFLQFSIVIFKSELVDIDYAYVIEPLKSVHSVSDYLDISKDIILDIQPIRDISLWLDLYIESYTGFQVHGFVNAFLWGATAFVLYLIIKALSLNYWFVGVLPFLCHPIAAWVVAWPSARKHILSMFFISLFSYCSVLLKQNRLKYPILIFIFYFLSIFSQPISVLFIIPFFLYFFEDIKAGKKISLFYLLVLVFLVCIVGNYFYYKLSYPSVVGVPKMLSQKNTFVIAIAGISRSITQIFLPIQFAYDYLKTSWLTFIGLPIFSILLYCSIPLTSKDFAFFFIIIILSPFALMYHQVTNIFVSDTYIIIPLFSTCLLLVFWGHVIFKNKYGTFFFTTLVFFLAIKSFREQLITTNSYNYFKQSYIREPTCRNTVPFADLELRNRNFSSFYEVSSHMLNQKCLLLGGSSLSNSQRILSFRVIMDNGLEISEKINLIKRNSYNFPEVVEILNVLKKWENDDRIIVFPVNKKLNQSQILLVIDILEYFCSNIKSSCYRNYLLDINSFKN